MNQRIRFLLLFLNACTLLGIVMSWKLWSGSRLFPDTPLFDFASTLSNNWDLGILALLMLSIASSLVIRRSRIPIFLIVLSLLALIALDVHRMQVWVFHFLMAYGIFLSFPKVYGEEEEGLAPVVSGLQILTLSMYLWTGINKLNPNFFDYVAAYIAAPLSHQFTSIVYFDEIVMMAPFFGLAFIPGLIFPLTRKWTILTIVIYHGIAIFLVGFFSYNENSIIIPWNLFILASVFLLFYQKGGMQPNFFRFHAKANISIPIMLAGLFPLLSYFDSYPFNLSWDVYSGRIPYESVRIPSLEVDYIPQEIDAYATSYGGHVYIDTYTWCMKETNVPPFGHPWANESVELELREMLKSPN